MHVQKVKRSLEKVDDGDENDIGNDNGHNDVDSYGDNDGDDDVGNDDGDDCGDFDDDSDDENDNGDIEEIFVIATSPIFLLFNYVY